MLASVILSKQHNLKVRNPLQFIEIEMMPISVIKELQTSSISSSNMKSPSTNDFNP